MHATMKERKVSAIAALLLVLVAALWGIASSFQTVKGWMEGLPNMLSEFLLHPLFLFLLFAVAIGLAIKALSTKGEKSNDVAQPPINIAPVISPTISPVISPTISPTNKQTVTQRPLEPPRIPKTNIVFVRAETIDAVFQEADRSDMLSWSESSPSESSRPLAVVYFRNEGGSGTITTANNVNAQVNYYDSEGQEILSRLGGCWLETGVDMVDFPVGRTHALIVATVKDGRTWLLWNRRVPYDDGFAGDTVKSDATESKKDVRTAEVKLIGEWDDVLCRVRLNYSIVNDRPQLARQQQ